MTDEILVKYTDTTAINLIREGSDLYLEVIGHRIGYYSAPDEEKAHEMLQRITNGDETLVERLFQEIEWLPGYTVDDVLESLERIFEQGQEIAQTEHSLRGCSPGMIQRVLDRISAHDTMVVVEKPTLDNPTVTVEEV